MGYFQNTILIKILFSISSGLVIMSILYLVSTHILRNKNKWKARYLTPTFNQSKDNITVWVDMVDKRLKKSGLRIRGPFIVALNTGLSILGFLISLNLFRNIAASIFFAGVFFVIPEYVLFLYESKRKLKIEDQMLVAIRIFIAEYYKTKNIEKTFLEISSKVEDPVGGYFSQTYMDIIMGQTFSNSVANLATKVDSEYWQMFVQLIHQLKSDSSVIGLFTDLITRIERSIELSRTNEASLGGERVLALVLSMLPIPGYYFMASIVPETTIFVVETPTGRILITLSMISLFLFIMLDKLLRRVE